MLNHKIGVIFIGEDCNELSEENVLCPDCPGSSKYLKFLKQLGTFVRLKHFEGFSGGLDTSEDLDGPFSLINFTETQHIMFHVCTLIPTLLQNGKINVNNKKRHLGNDNVHIVFNESEHAYEQNILSGEFNFVHIEIHPLKKGFYRVTLHKKEQVPWIGVLLNQQIVSQKALVPLVLQAAVQADVSSTLNCSLNQKLTLRKIASMLAMEKNQKLSGIGNYSNFVQRLLQIKKLANFGKVVTSPSSAQMENK